MGVSGRCGVDVCATVLIRHGAATDGVGVTSGNYTYSDSAAVNILAHPVVACPTSASLI